MDADGRGLRRFNAKTPRRNAAAPQPKDLNRSTQRKRRRNRRSKNFVENAQFLGIALQRVSSVLAIQNWRLDKKEG
jgi:hypothetical protein